MAVSNSTKFIADGDLARLRRGKKAAVHGSHIKETVWPRDMEGPIKTNCLLVGLDVNDRGLMPATARHPTGCHAGLFANASSKLPPKDPPSDSSSSKHLPISAWR